MRRSPASKPQRVPATHHEWHGVRRFHSCSSIGDDTLWGVVRNRKSAANVLAALKSIRAAHPDDDWVFVIHDNLPAHKGTKIREWAAQNHVESCFTPTYNSNHPNHVVLTRRLHRYLAWRNANARHPNVLAAQRKERTRVRAERQHRRGRPRAA